MPRASRDPRPFVVMGRVTAPHGVRGDVKVRWYGESPEALADFKAWWVRPVGATDWREMKCVSARAHGDMLLATLEGLSGRDGALALKGADVGLPRDALPPPGEGEVYASDLVGAAVVNREGRALGQVKDIGDHGAHPLLVVAGEGGEMMVPWTSEHVVRVDVAARRIEVDWQADW